MSEKPGSIDRLRSYLDRLPSYQRLDLLKHVAIAGGRGDRSAELALVVEALRPGLEQDLRADAGLQFAKLVFFSPCESFLVEERGTVKHRGFIHRPSLDGLWKWLNFRTEWSNWQDRTQRAIDTFLSGNTAEADALVVGMRADAAAAIHEAMDIASRSDLYRQKFSQQIGGQGAYADLVDIAELFEREVDLAKLGRTVAASVGKGAPLDADKIAELLAVVEAQDDPLVLVFVRMLKELPDPTDLIRLLTTAEGTDDGARLANSRFAGCVDVLLADLDFTAARIDQLIGQPRHFDRLATELNRFHRIARGLGVLVDLDRAPAWRTTLGERRRMVAASLSGEIGEAHPTVVRALRAPRNEREEEMVDEVIARAIYLARLLATLRPIRSELAVNGLVMESVRKIEAFLETVYAVVRVDTRAPAAMPAADRARRQAFHTIVRTFTGASEEAEAEDEDDTAGARAEAV